MFFCRFALVVAVLVLILGLVQAAAGFWIASLGPDEMQAYLRRYSTARTTGEMIDRSLFMILIAIGLGALSEIGLAVNRLSPR